MPEIREKVNAAIRFVRGICRTFARRHRELMAEVLISVNMRDGSVPAIGESVDITEVLKPIYNFKAN